MKTILLLTTTLLLTLSVNVYCQEPAKKSHLIQEVQRDKSGQGEISIYQDAGIEDQMKDIHESNSLSSFIEGYRIQLYSGSGVNSKKEAMTVRVKFLGQFPNEKVDLFYNAPFWRVRVGNYRFKSEALSLLTQVKRQFPNSYVVKDNNIKKSDVK